MADVAGAGKDRLLETNLCKGAVVLLAFEIPVRPGYALVPGRGRCLRQMERLSQSISSLDGIDEEFMMVFPSNTPDLACADGSSPQNDNLGQNEPQAISARPNTTVMTMSYVTANLANLTNDE